MSQENIYVGGSQDSTRVPLPPTHMSQIFRYCFTWHANILERQNLEDVLRLVCKSYTFQLERGGQSGNDHYQGRFTLLKKARVETIAKFLQKHRLDGIHLSPEKDEYGSTLYCSKADTRVAGPWTYPEKETEYKGEDLPPYERLFAWQQSIVDYVKRPVSNDREILWLVDRDGCSGKSTLAKYLGIHHGASLHSWSDTRHTLHSVVAGGPRKTYVFDLTRSKPSNLGGHDLYSALESIKNGCIRDTMYEGKDLFMHPPHVIVFANLPPLSEALSKDRLTVLDIPKTLSIQVPKPKFEWPTDVLSEDAAARAAVRVLES